MASITQKIPNYIQGMSEQPDELKLPGQVKNLINGIPDVTRGLMKRPGSRYIKNFAPEAGDLSWFHIYTDNENQFIGNVSKTGKLTIFSVKNEGYDGSGNLIQNFGQPIPIDYGDVEGAGNQVCNYLKDWVDTNQIQTLTVNESTFFVNRTQEVKMLDSFKDNTAPEVHESFVELKTISYGKQYSIDVYDPENNDFITYHRAVAMSMKNDTITQEGTPTTYSDNGKCSRMGRQTITASGTHGSTGRATAGKTHRNLRFDFDLRCQPVPDGGGTENPAYKDSYQAFPKLQFGGEHWVLNDEYQFTTKKGSTGTFVVTKSVEIKTRANLSCIRPPATSSSSEENITAEGILGDIEIEFTNGGLNGVALNTSRLNGRRCGKGWHMQRYKPFNVTTSEPTLMNITTSELNDVSTLPDTCRHGYVLKVVNSIEEDDDYYLKFRMDNFDEDIPKLGNYSRPLNDHTITITTATPHGLVVGDELTFVWDGDLKLGEALASATSVATVATVTGDVSTSTTFTIESDATNATPSAAADNWVAFSERRFGHGVWEECAQPGITKNLDNTSLPIQLTRVLPTNDVGNLNGKFKLSYPEWQPRIVGDENTNPTPSFVGKKISKILFYRNRLVILSGNNVILSQLNDFFNFWSITAMSTSDDDPIDLQASSLYPTELFDGVEHNDGLILFSNNQQFLLNTEAEKLTASTAKVDYLCSYNYNNKTKPISLGITSGFLSSTGLNSRFYEMAGIRRVSEPTVQEQSKIVSKFLPLDLTLTSGSRENNLCLFGTVGKNEVWGYRYYNQGERRAQSAWFRWQLHGTLLYHAIMDDVYYAVLSQKAGIPNGDSTNHLTIEAFDVKKTGDTLTVGSVDEQELVHLDCKKVFTTSDLNYDSLNNVTTFDIPVNYYNSDRQLAAFVTTTGNNSGRYGDISVDSSGDTKTGTLKGDWTDNDIVVGYKYTWEIEIPTIHVSTSSSAAGTTVKDTRGSLVVHRLNFGFGSVGSINIEMERKGRKDYINTYQSLIADNYNISTAAVEQEYIHKIPAYDRNTNLTIRLKSDHPTPATLHSLTWEGDYSTRFYRNA